ncbi:PTS mannose transporter subunit IIA [Mediterraneibacter butyricigenes]|uniref:Mannitol-specific phosphotransferase enzyme IIA component n=1 Tax=Mediterraneibacter butyricigenes TaxID=2316025 RepID=A0A391P0J4_9FIRM|nr:PTS sugar transporter subunit IIA [Mediterraneibacter butyricigenes]GCA66737.1 PTS mannose transporter subunit IIA [Mediterraneibacter butyricigenes]
MFFKSKKKELLLRENIRVNCKADTQEQVIRQVGQMLVDSGYVKQSYVDGMVEREKTFSTFMGNGLALPHGVEAAKKEIKSSGIAVLTFPEGTDWDGNKVNVVIGIAGVGEEHLDILSVIADKMMDETAAEKLATGDVDTVYEILGGK